jgi:hypothetical protein
MSQESPATYIYIAGKGHSGSTLLEWLVSGHPQIVAAGELGKLSLQFARETIPYPGWCSCGQRPMNCAIWRAVEEAVAARTGVRLSQNPFGFRVSEIGLEEDFGIRAPKHWLLRKRIRSLRYAGYARVPVVRHLMPLAGVYGTWAQNRLFVANVFREQTRAIGVVDSSKDYLAMREIYVSAREQMKILFITRDPCGSAWSNVKSGMPAQEAARTWATVNGRILRLLDGVRQDDWMQVRYEDLCRDPAETSRRVFRFLGYEDSPAMATTGRQEHHTIGGNKIRFNPIAAIREDLSWRENLSDSDVRSIDYITRPIAIRLNYLSSSVERGAVAPFQ